MPRFHLELANGHRIPDPRGLDCKNEEDAVAKARHIANVIADEVGETPRCLVVVDDEGKMKGNGAIPLGLMPGAAAIRRLRMS
jgi:Domain of unknown function (DUF6894)